MAPVALCAAAAAGSLMASTLGNRFVRGAFGSLHASRTQVRRVGRVEGHSEGQHKRQQQQQQWHRRVCAQQPQQLRQRCRELQRAAASERTQKQQQQCHHTLMHGQWSLSAAAAFPGPAKPAPIGLLTPVLHASRQNLPARTQAAASSAAQPQQQQQQRPTRSRGWILRSKNLEVRRAARAHDGGCMVMCRCR